MKIYLVRRSDDEDDIIPYPGSTGAGTYESARRVVAPNRHLGYQVVMYELNREDAKIVLFEGQE